ncbi:hypothetical protein [Pseudooceanicola nitratireducens]|nr:hypothetical protein [Pseudooceanicola nitratireducens]
MSLLRAIPAGQACPLSSFYRVGRAGTACHAMDLSFPSAGIALLQIRKAPDRAAGEAMVTRIRERVIAGEVRGLVLDLSEQLSSALTGALARNLLTMVDGRLARDLGADQVLPLVIAAPPGSFGHGIGRMIVGHSYGLTRLKVCQFDTLPDAMAWLRDHASG